MPTKITFHEGGAMELNPIDGYPWLTLGLTRAMLRQRLRTIEGLHQHRYRDATDVHAVTTLAGIRLAGQAADRGDLELAMDIADQAWYFYHRLPEMI